jgi:hypothetical protein
MMKSKYAEEETKSSSSYFKSKNETMTSKNDTSFDLMQKGVNESAKMKKQ